MTFLKPGIGKLQFSRGEAGPGLAEVHLIRYALHRAGRGPGTDGARYHVRSIVSIERGGSE